MKILAKTSDLSRDEWLELRRRGIGGSDAPAVAGIDPWRTPLDVFLEKTGQAPPRKENEAMIWGRLLEDVVAKEFARRTGLKVRRVNAIVQHPQHEWMIGNVDRLIVGERVGLEIKTTSTWLASDWDGDEIPANYILQVMHYMAVTGYDAWFLAALIGGQRLVIKRLERDDELIEQLIEIEQAFWVDHVLKGVPPIIDGSPAATELVSRMYPKATSTDIVDLPSEAEEAASRLEAIKAEIKSLEERKAEYENKLKMLLGESEQGRVGKYIVTWKNVTHTRLDADRLRREMPDVYEKYMTKSEYRRFSIKKIEEDEA